MYADWPWRSPRGNQPVEVYRKMKWLSKNTPVLLLTLGSLALLLGMIGHWGAITNPRNSSSLGPTIHDWLNAFLTSLSHLSLENFEPPDGSDLDWTSYVITASRFLAATVVVIGAANILATITNDFGRLQFWWRTRFGRDLDLIVGLGWHGKELIEHIESQRGNSDDDSGYKTIAIDSNASEEMYDLCKKANVVCLRSDINSLSAFENIHFDNIKRIYLVTGSDETNAKILRLLSKLSKGVRRLECHVGVSSPSLYDILIDSDECGKHLDVRTFNDAEITAQLLLKQRSLVHTFSSNVKISRLILLGHGLMFDSILFQWLQNQILEPNIDIEIDLLHPDGHAAAIKFVSTYPCFKIDDDSSNIHFGDGVTHVVPTTAKWLEERVLPCIRFHQLPISQGHCAQYIEDLVSGSSKDCRCVVAVVADDLVEAVHIGKAIFPVVQYFAASQNVLNNRVIFDSWIYLNTQDISLYEELEKTLKTYHDDLFVFRDYLGQCSKSSISNDVVERAAMYVHTCYSNFLGDPKKLWFGESDFEGAAPPSSLWDRESSRLCGAHAWIKRGILSRFERGDANVSFKQLSQSTLNALSRIEHRRWCTVHLLRGWAPLIDLSTDRLLDQEMMLVEQWYLDKDGKSINRKRFRHLCLLPFDSLFRIEEVLKSQGYDFNETKKDERIIVSTGDIIDFAEKS